MTYPKMSRRDRVVNNLKYTTHTHPSISYIVSTYVSYPKMTRKDRVVNNLEYTTPNRSTSWTAVPTGAPAGWFTEEWFQVGWFSPTIDSSPWVNQAEVLTTWLSSAI
jgi:hypothetical protein